MECKNCKKQALLTIQDYVHQQLEFMNNGELASKIGVSSGMISQYKTGYNASLDVAVKVYHLDRVVLHPFAKESLELEIKLGRTCS